MHDGVRTNYDKELFAQGVANSLCGGLGALPITGVIVRSSANVEAGAKTRASAIFHGIWLVLFVASCRSCWADSDRRLGCHPGLHWLQARESPAIMKLWKSDRPEFPVFAARHRDRGHGPAHRCADRLRPHWPSCTPSPPRNRGAGGRARQAVDVAFRGAATFAHLPRTVEKLDAIDDEWKSTSISISGLCRSRHHGTVR